MTKTDVIEKVYQDFYGSIKQTYEQAKKIDPTIKYDDIKRYFETTKVRKTNLRGYNSFIAHHFREEYQIDLCFFNENTEDEYKIGLVVIDIFSKFMEVIPLKTKQPKDLLEGLIEGMKNIGGKPKTIYSDDEGSLNSKLLQDYFKEHNIRHLTTRGHAGVAERAIRTIKEMIYKRLEKHPDSHWYDVKILANALVTYNFKNVSSATGYTPNDGRDKKNELNVRLNLELGRVTKRKYPEIEVDDKVRIYRKRKNFEKGVRVPVWSEAIYTVDKIEDSMGQKMYFVSGRDRGLLRHEILKISKE
jgi:hypothetical protein